MPAGLNGEAWPRVWSLLIMLGAGVALLFLHEREVALTLIGAALGTAAPMPRWTSAGMRTGRTTEIPKLKDGS